MGTLVQYLNNNSGAVLSVLTAVYVVSTLILCIFARSSNKTALRLYDLAHRPVVLCDFVTDNGLLCSRIRNIGRMPAVDTTVTIGGDDAARAILQANPTFRDGISFLTPGQELVYLYAAPGDAVPLSQVTFALRYTDQAGREYEDSYRYDLSPYRMELINRQQNAPLIRSLEMIAEELRSLRRT